MGSRQQPELLNKVMQSLVECQLIYIHMFERAQCKLLNIIEQSCGQVYEILADQVFANLINDDSSSDLMDNLLSIIDNHFSLIKKQNKPFSSSLNLIFFKLLNFLVANSISDAQINQLQESLDKWVSHVSKRVQHSGVLLHDLHAKIA